MLSFSSAVNKIRILKNMKTNVKKLFHHDMQAAEGRGGVAPIHS
jgi:hypothetical protein